MRLVIHPSEESLDLGERPLVVGSAADCDVRVPGVAARHIRIDRDRVEALVACVVGKIPLDAGAARKLVPGCAVELGAGARLLVIEEDLSSSVPTRELALRMAADALRGAASVTTPRVRVVEGPNAGADLPLVENKAHIVGRGATADLRLDEDTGISRAHVEITLKNGLVLVRDLNATQGSFLGPKRLEPLRKAVWSSDTMLRVSERTVLGVLLPPAARETAEEYIRLRRGPDEPPDVEPSPLEAARRPSENDTSEAAPPEASSEPPSMPGRVGGTSAAIAEVDLQSPSPPLAARKRHMSTTTERLVLIVGSTLLVAFGVSAAIWLLR